MKRIFFAAAVVCSISLWSCDNDQDNHELTPYEQEIFELDKLIASQSDFDEAALIADLTSGTMITKKNYYYSSEGPLGDLYINGGAIDEKIIFFENGTGKDYYTSCIPGDTYHCSNFTWRYDSSTGSLITHRQGYDMAGIYYDECSAKVLYYNSEDHFLILEGSFFCVYRRDDIVFKTRMTFEIDPDPATREYAMGLCDNE